MNVLDDLARMTLAGLVWILLNDYWRATDAKAAWYASLVAMGACLYYMTGLVVEIEVVGHADGMALADGGVECARCAADMGPSPCPACGRA